MISILWLVVVINVYCHILTTITLTSPQCNTVKNLRVRAALVDLSQPNKEYSQQIITLHPEQRHS